MQLFSPTACVTGGWGEKRLEMGSCLTVVHEKKSKVFGFAFHDDQHANPSNPADPSHTYIQFKVIAIPRMRSKRDILPS